MKTEGFKGENSSGHDYMTMVSGFEAWNVRGEGSQREVCGFEAHRSHMFEACCRCGDTCLEIENEEMISELQMRFPELREEQREQSSMGAFRCSLTEHDDRRHEVTVGNLNHGGRHEQGEHCTAGMMKMEDNMVPINVSAGSLVGVDNNMLKMCLVGEHEPDAGSRILEGRKRAEDVGLCLLGLAVQLIETLKTVLTLQWKLTTQLYNIVHWLVELNIVVKVDLFYQTAGNCLLLCVDTWSKFLYIKPLKNKIAGVIGEAIAEFLADLGHFETVELSYDNEPALAAGARMTKLIKSNNGLHTILQPGKFYEKARTALAERCIQTVRAQGKTLISHLQDRARVVLNEMHVLQAWSMVHACWLLNRYHVTSATGMTAYLSVKGRPYKGRVCCFGESVHGLDPLQAKYKSQWRPGAWLGKDSMDHDLVLVGTNEIVRCKAVRKTGEHWDGELLVGAIVGPWDMKRGAHTRMETKPISTPVPELLSDVPEKPERKTKTAKTGVDPDAEDVIKYAADHPDEDQEVGEPRESEKGRFDHAQFKKKAAEDLKEQSKAVRFDPDTPIPEPSTKALKTSSSSDVSTRVVRQVAELDLYVEDEPDAEYEEIDSYDWSEQQDHCEKADFLTQEEMKRRGFHDEGRGPPQVSEEELQVLDQQAMLAEVSRLDDLQVLANVEPHDNIEEAMKLDTRIVFDWRFRESCWIRRARLVAREFRGGAASSMETFSPTSPLSFIKLLLSLSITMKLMVSVMDISDAFLQVEQREFVVIEVPSWIRTILQQPNLMFWKLQRCLPGQRNAALEWNRHFSKLCAEFQFCSFQGGTLYRHETERQFLSVHIDDIILVGEEACHRLFVEHFSKKLKLKADGRYGVEKPGTLFYLKRRITFDEEGLEIAANKKYVPKLSSLLEVQERRERGVPSNATLDVYDGQMSIALSSMEAEVLAATGLLAEGIMLKQSLQFLLGCRQDLSDESKVEMKLYLDSTSAQAFFQRIGPGRAKHLCTRILWGQEAMRRGWYRIGRIATKDNPADLNTKSLSRERREYLSKLIGLWSSSFKEEVMPKVQRIIQVLLTAGLLKGCNSDEASEMTCGGMRQAVVHNAWSLHILCWAVFILMSVIAILVFNMQRMRTQLARYRCVWRGLKKELELRRSENPFLMAEGEGEESAHSDNDDDDYDDYGDDEGDGHGGYDSHHGHDETSENGYIEGESHLRLLHPSGGGSGNGDVAGGPNPHYEDVPRTEDVEETPMKRRKCMHEGVHTMENPDENEEENDDEQRQQPSSSSRGVDAETAQHAVSDFVAEELMQFLSPQDDDEPKEIDGEEWHMLSPKSIESWVLLPWPNHTTNDSTMGRWPDGGCGQLGAEIGPAELFSTKEVVVVLGITHVETEGTSCSLVSLVLTSHGRPVDLQPAFMPDHYAYNATLDFSMGSFSVNVRPDTGCEDEGVPKHPTAVGIGGQQTLRFFASKAESARKQAYDLHVQRLLGSETTLQSLAVEHGRLTPAFAPEVRSYKVSLDLESDMLKVWYRLRDNEQRLRVAAQKEEMARRLEGLERQEALHVVSGEVQYQDAYSSFMLDVGHKRSVTMTIQCADPTQASIGTYTLELQRGSCPPQRPYFEPDKRKCVNFCPEGFYRNDLDERCSRCNDNCKVCTGLLTCKMCVPDDVQYTYVIQPDGKCEAQANHIYARYKWWCAGFALLLLFLVCFGCAGICTLCHAPRKGAASKPERRRYFEDDLEEDKQLLQYPPGRRLGGY
ncbi:Retrovirus-related Pol polyprotein from transposon TNT 1-94 [Includes: Protease [Durusdinium trenchii]|uniref:Retrovirus-related Pol polyprotein from transposon TNT 1-94 n=1 Tax=Durusdinium trenchii TaxID=1381693 RepID=A0ABP0I006_9DINO